MPDDSPTAAAFRGPLTPAERRRFWPRIGSPAYHILLSVVAILILGPLGGISAAFMNFSIGFFISGQVLAGILGSTVTLDYPYVLTTPPDADALTLKVTMWW